MRKELGFTLIEFLVVLFIISLISGAALANYGSSKQRYYVSKATQQFASDLRRAQNMALTGKIQGMTVPQGYGIHIVSSSQYLLFYNTDSQKTYQGSGVLETINIEGGSALAPVNYDIYFTPPEPLTYLQGVNSGLQLFVISSGSYSKTVSINVNGKIEIN
jgi:prepilin-type N-terminal cleavage/methylation domain-containing protein